MFTVPLQPELVCWCTVSVTNNETQLNTAGHLYCQWHCYSQYLGPTTPACSGQYTTGVFGSGCEILSHARLGFPHRLSLMFSLWQALWIIYENVFSGSHLPLQAIQLRAYATTSILSIVNLAGSCNPRGGRVFVDASSSGVDRDLFVITALWYSTKRTLLQ